MDGDARRTARGGGGMIPTSDPSARRGDMLEDPRRAYNAAAAEYDVLTPSTAVFSVKTKASAAIEPGSAGGQDQP